MFNLFSDILGREFFDLLDSSLHDYFCHSIFLANRFPKQHHKGITITDKIHATDLRFACGYLVFNHLIKLKNLIKVLLVNYITTLVRNNCIHPRSKSQNLAFLFMEFCISFGETHIIAIP